MTAVAPGLDPGATVPLDGLERPGPTVLIDARTLQSGAEAHRLLQEGRAALPAVRFVALIDPAAPPPAGFDRVFTNAYAAGTPDCFVRWQPGSGDHLFAARLLLRDDVPSLAVEPLLPQDPLEREVAAYWLRCSRLTTRERLWTDVAGLIGTPTRRADRRTVVLAADPQAALATALRARGATVVGAEIVALLSPRAGLALFIIGNTAADAASITLLRRFGGDVVLTTSCLLAAYDGGRAVAPAEAELGRAVPAGEMAQWREGIARPSALLLGDVAAAARDLFVPSAWVAAEIAARYGRTATVLPIAAAMAPDGGQRIAAAAAGLQAEACVWAVELLRFWGAEVRLVLDCPLAERAGLATLAARLGIGGLVEFGSGAGDVAVVLAMRGGSGRESALVAASGRNCIASQCLAETVGAPPWVRVVPDQPSPPLLAAAMRDALAAPAPDAADWVARHDPAAVAALLA